MTEQRARRLRPGDRIRWCDEERTVTCVHLTVFGQDAEHDSGGALCL
jgi:hypothetical protein